MNKNLELVLNELKNAIDATIQRFEFVIELYWKTFKKGLAENGIETSLPKEALREAFAANWISDDKLWIDMMLDRNLTSHTYREKTAQEIYGRIRVYYPQLKSTFADLRERFL